MSVHLHISAVVGVYFCRPDGVPVAVDGVPIAEAQAVAEPLFQIDPAYAFHDLFTIQYSENLIYSNVPVPNAHLPEPATYTMLLAGLGLLGFTTHRRNNFSA